MANGQSADLILAAGRRLIARAGPEGASVRAIADEAGVPPSTLQHHFRSKARLLDAIYGQAASDHLADSAAVLAALAPGPSDDAARRMARGGIAAALIAEWLREGAAATRTAVVLHLLVHAVHDRTHAARAARWLDDTVAALARAGLPDGDELDGDEALFVVELLVGLALASGPAAFRRENDVLNRELVRLACGTGDAGAGHWLAHFRALRGKPLGDPADAAPPGSVAADILDAGVTLMAETGADAMSYRKIAARARVAPSSVLHHFPDRRTLLTALYRAVHRRFMSAEPLARISRHVPTDMAPDMADAFTYMIVEQRAGDAPLFLASCELFLIGWREPDLAADALAMRLERGAARDWAFAGPRDALAAHLQSLWSIGMALTRFARPSAPSPADVARRLRAGMRIMAGGA